MGGSFRGGFFYGDGLFIASQLPHTRRLTHSGSLFGGISVALCRRGYYFRSTLSYNEVAA